MKCSNCGKKEANFIYTESINGIKKEIRLCSDCADKLGFLDMSISMPNIDFSNFFGDFLNEYDTLMPSIFADKTKVLKCKECGMDYDEFLNVGRFGCSNCYEVFEEKIGPLLKQLHGDTKYLGKKSGNDFKKMRVKDNKESFKETKNSNKIDVLKEELKQAIKVENYEEAAKIRDEIKVLEQTESNSNKEKTSSDVSSNNNRKDNIKNNIEKKEDE